MVKSFEILSQSPSQTKKIGQILAEEILKAKTKRAFVLGLIGDLGGGKTTFLKGFAKGLGIKERILSPTFIIFKKFKVKSLNFKVFYHIDCYRISKPKEILDLGFKEIVLDPKNIVAIEWADRIKKILPRGTLILKFDFLNQKERKITLWEKNV
jgi:tRNA threonylcarbamoyladenosine biosynthesis protein TsaE